MSLSTSTSTSTSTISSLSTATNSTSSLSTSTSVLGSGTTSPPGTTCVPVHVGNMGDVIIQFRPQSAYQGEFGFDWMRIGDWSITGTLNANNTDPENYKLSSLLLGGSGFSGTTDALVKLEQEYTPVTIESVSCSVSLSTSTSTSTASSTADETKYYVPRLTLFPATATTELATGAQSSATLEVLVKIKTVPDKIEFKYDKSLFDLSRDEITDKAVGTKRKATDGAITITCKKDLNADTPITVYATKGKVKTLAGKLIVCKNKISIRKQLTVVLIPVKTEIISAQVQIGVFNYANTIFLSRVLNQALMTTDVVNAPTFDLTNDSKFTIRTNPAAPTVPPVVGEFVHAVTNELEPKFSNGGLTSGMLRYVTQKFIAANPTHKNSLKIFAFYGAYYSPPPYPTAPGFAAPFGGLTVAVFNGTSGYQTMLAHEAGHALGLAHAHLDGTAALPEQKFIYTSRRTDNIMSYNGAVRKVTWRWQWKIINRKF